MLLFRFQTAYKTLNETEVLCLLVQDVLGFLVAEYCNLLNARWNLVGWTI